jgi:NitT/TauT family transport system substrate-binding protein
LKLRPLLSLLVVAFTVVFAGGCGSCASDGPAGAGPDGSAPPAGPPIRMGYSAWPGWIPWKVTEEQRLFQARGVNVELRWFDGYLDSIQALNAGQLDANTQTLNDTLSSVAAGADQVIVLVNDNSTGNDKIIAREGINEIADLKGKKIAAEEGTVDHFLLLLGLKKAGLTRADIEFQPLETGAAAAAFAAGQLDAVAVFAPFTTQALKRAGSKEIFSSKDFPGSIPDHLVVSRKLVQERPNDVQAMVDAWFDTVGFVAANTKPAYEIMAKRAGVSVEEYRAYDSGTRIFTIEENLEAFAPGGEMKSLPHAADQVSRFLLESGLTKKAPDFSKIFDDRFVKAHAEKHKKK